MAARLESAARSPALRSALKAALAGLTAYFFRSGTGILGFLIFFIVFWFFYFRPQFQSRQFLASALILFALPLFLPPVGDPTEWLLVLIFAAALFLLLGVKNLVLLKREGSYEALHLLIVFSLSALYLLSSLPLLPLVVLFIALFFLFREFYFVRAPLFPQRLVLAAAALAFVATEIAWLLSFLSVGLLAGAAFLALTAYLFHDILLRHFEGKLSRQIVLRNITLFIILSLVLALLPS